MFYIGTSDAAVLSDLRCHMLAHFKNLPVAAEYMHRDIYDIAEVYGKDTFLMIDKLGTDKMPLFFTLKGRADGWLNKLSFIKPHLTDRLLQRLSRLFPAHLPKRMKQYRDKYQHHLMLKMSGEGVEEARNYLREFFREGGGEFLSAKAKKARTLSCTALPLPVRQCVITPFTPQRWKIFWRWILRCAAMTETGSKPCLPG